MMSRRLLHATNKRISSASADHSKETNQLTKRLFTTIYSDMDSHTIHIISLPSFSPSIPPTPAQPAHRPYPTGLIGLMIPRGLT